MCSVLTRFVRRRIVFFAILQFPHVDFSGSASALLLTAGDGSPTSALASASKLSHKAMKTPRRAKKETHGANSLCMAWPAGSRVHWSYRMIWQVLHRRLRRVRSVGQLATTDSRRPRVLSDAWQGRRPTHTKGTQEVAGATHVAWLSAKWCCVVARPA